ncbi:MAG: heavy metal-associated domain-containing protein [Bacteroidales bacterium]|nr:heavy metal-associated domain-containing protein [Bacteroidales bacterium]MDZ4203317.1 heavy metal-associated domain-containing protein [Bacteroidales bacterium]
MKNKNLLMTLTLAIIMLVLSTGQLVAQKTSDRKLVKIQTNLDCHSCKQKIEKHMTFEKGVTSVEADVPTKIVTIGYRNSRTNEEKLCEAIEKLGYKVEVIKENKEEKSGIRTN